MEIIFATSNEHKLFEIRTMLEGTGIEAKSLKDIGFTGTIEENGSTFAENAAIKAETIRNLTGKIVMADDSGIMIDYLNGRPGIYSSRFLGENTPHSEKRATILKRMQNVPDAERGARFVCAIAISYPDSITEIFEGVFEGRIAHEEKGENGFGYDSIFYVPEEGMTSAELSEERKNELSHRGKALRQAVEALKQVSIY